MNVHDAIFEINATRLNHPDLDALVSIITHAAVIDKNIEARNFLWLCHWQPQQIPN